MISERVRALAVPHALYGGQVVLYMLPYRALAVDVVIETLNPDGDALDTGRTLFALCDTLTVAADFQLADDAPPALRAFEVYWQTRPADVGERWALFKQLLDTEVVNAWWDAYNATRAGARAAEEDDSPEA